jgi:hypothetical protein
LGAYSDDAISSDAGDTAEERLAMGRAVDSSR